MPWALSGAVEEEGNVISNRCRPRDGQHRQHPGRNNVQYAVFFEIPFNSRTVDVPRAFAWPTILGGFNDRDWLIDVGNLIQLLDETSRS